jgi:hypothetical protein
LELEILGIIKSVYKSDFDVYISHNAIKVTVHIMWHVPI